MNKLFDSQYENILGYILIIFCIVCLLVFAIGNIIINIKYYTKIYNKYKRKKTEAANKK